MVSPFRQAWGLLKSEVLLWPKRFDNKHWMMQKPGPGGYTLRDKKGESKAFVSLPNLGGDYGRSTHHMTDEELQNAFLETDVHETMHETLGNIGEDYEKPLHNEYPAMVAEYLQFARRPREQIPSSDKVSQLLDEGMDDREIAMQIAQQMAPMHQQVSPGKTMAGIAHYVTGPPRESYEDIQTGEPMDIAFQLLKRQTTLGEFHPDFPSPYGPVTMRRHHPTQEWYDKRESGGMGEEFNENFTQPAENLITEGLKQQPSNVSNDEWESRYQDEMKPFNLAGKGTWVHPAGMKGGDSMNSQDRQHIGIRMPLKDVQGQFRNRAAQDEGPEGWVNQDIPPERLVNLPDWWTAQRPVTWGKRGEYNHLF